MTRLAIAFLLALAACRSTDPFARWLEHEGGACDVLISDARLVDGTGTPERRADVIVSGGLVVFVGDVDERRVTADRTIDAAGRVLAPGFIDLHAHGDPLTESFECALAMGVTTVVLGQDGVTAGASWSRRRAFARAGLGGWLDELDRSGTDVNVAALSGHGTLRDRCGVGPRQGPLADEDTEALQAALRQDLAAGAFGMSTGLEYVPGRYAEEAELVALAGVVGEFDGVVMSHMRTEDDDAIEGAIDELVAQGARARVHISLLKVVYGKGAKRAERLLAFIESRRARGVRLTADIYPYTAGYTGVAILFPEWALPPQDYSRVVASRRGDLAAYLRVRVTKRNGPAALLFGSAPYAGQTLEEASEAAGLSFVDFLIEIGPGGGSGAHFTQDAATHDALVASPLTAISTDGGPSVPHPRSTGTYARLFERHVEGTGALTLEAAVHQATGLPASVLGLDDIGVIRPGARADLVLFDPARVHERSDYLDPAPFAEGFDAVLVNGVVAREDGRLGQGRHGRVLRARP